MRIQNSFIILTLAGANLLCADSDVKSLQEVKTIYVAPLDGRDVEMANLITAKLVSYLAKKSGVTIVDSDEKADAILVAHSLVQSGPNEYGHTRYRVHGPVRLDSKEGTVLWADDVSNSAFARSATSGFADNVAKKLAQAILSASGKK